MPDDVPASPLEAPEAPRQDATPEAASDRAQEPTTSATGRRPSFRDIRRQLTEEELRQPGVQKLLIEDFERAENECELLRSYIDKYHQADKLVGILNEKLTG